MLNPSSKVVNRTPHDINVVLANGSTVVYPRPATQEEIARVTVSKTEVGTLANGVTVWRAVYGDVNGLPAPEDGVLHIVSMMVRNALPHRLDLLSPADLMRDAAGQPIGTNGFLCS